VPTLTIEPGVELRFDQYLRVGEYTPGGLSATTPASDHWASSINRLIEPTAAEPRAFFFLAPLSPRRDQYVDMLYWEGRPVVIHLS
jgi:hypothetical protein